MNVKRGLLRLWIAASFLWTVFMVGWGLYAWSALSDQWKVVAIGTTEPTNNFLVLLWLNKGSALSFIAPHLVLAVAVPLAVLVLSRVAVWVGKGFQPKVAA